MTNETVEKAVVGPHAQASHPDWRLRSYISGEPEWGGKTSAGRVTLYRVLDCHH